jgi:hypothetical protein
MYLHIFIFTAHKETKTKNCVFVAFNQQKVSSWVL